MTDRRDSPSVTQTQFYEAHQQLMDRMQELHRSQNGRIDDLRKDFGAFTTAMGTQLGKNNEQLRGHEKRLDDTEADIKVVTQKSAFVSGIGAVLAIAVGLLPLPWKH